MTHGQVHSKYYCLLPEKPFVFFMTALLIVGGVYSYVHTPIEAFPDVTNTQIIIGFITEKNVTDHMQFNADDVENLFTVSNLDNVWIMANVFESDITKVKPGYQADVTTLSYPDPATCSSPKCTPR